MKPTFHHRLVNGKHEDPCLYVRMLRERRAFLFDAGNINRLSAGELLRVTDVFVTHAHIDHFIGFDTLLRAMLHRADPLNVYGPENIIECIDGKLKGYTWNLIKEYPARIEAFGISGKEVRHSSFHAELGFQRLDRPSKPFSSLIMKEAFYCIKAANLSHGTPCLGFSLEEDFHINIDKSALYRMGLPVGPWLNEFKKLLREQAADDTEIVVNGRGLKLSDLDGIARISKGQKVSYLTDLSPDEKNITKAIDLVKMSDTLYCEAYFLHSEIDRALERNHLTARVAGEIAGRAGVKNLVVMHFSPKYRNSASEIEAEAINAFNKFST